jgi:hypothetical protein
MEQHPIPQQISSYEFKLVGEMTLRQFIKAAAGILLAVLINATHLMVIIKWPLMLVCGGGGLVLAFVPFEDRPLEKWAVAFLKAIYSPTIYTYKKRVDKNWLEVNINADTEEIQEETEDEMVAVKDAKKVNEFIQSLPSVKREEFNEENLDTPAGLVDKPMVQPATNPMVTAPVTEVSNEADWRDQKAELNLKTEKLEATGQAVFGSIPMPDIPEIPNIVVGMATDSMGKIIDGVIVEIQDEHGNPSRVLKTNSLGQFKTSTPLANGRYLIISEKEGYTFDRVNIDANNEIIKPIRIIASN